ncbi:MAG TPA: S9 family peptidase [Chthoniobacterales bacterium]|nr:S9 family peptidase [Chthoniobacterales bacterium]
MRIAASFTILSVALAASALAAPSAAVQKPPLIPLAHFFDNPKISSAALSPDGKRYAFLAPEKGFLNVWVCDVDADFATAKAVTHDTTRGILEFEWTRDGKYLLYLQDQGGDENFHLYRADPSQPAQAAVDLTPREGARAEIIDLPRDRPGEALVALNDRDKRYFDAYRLDLATGKLTLLEKNPGDVDSWYADAHGILRACVAQVAGSRTQIRVRDRGEGPFRAVATYEEEESADVQGFGADGSFLYVSDSRGSNTSHLAKLDLTTGKETIVTQDPTYDFGEVIVSDRTHELLAVTFQKDRLVYQPFDDQIARDLKILGTVHDGDILLRSSDDAEKKWIVAYNSPTDPGATYLYDRATGQAKFLYRPRPWLKSDPLVGMKPVEFKSRDGLALHGYLTLPAGVPAKNLPTVLVVHGGPWARDEWGYDPEVQLLANRGFAVMQVNYRGSTGYGKSFLEAGNREWGGRMLDDLIDTVDWLVREGIADPKHVGIYGGSYGGYATLSAVAFRPEVFACGVDYVGISNLLTFMKTIPPYWETFREQMYRRVGDPVKDEALLRARSPLFAADKIKAPLFVAQGYNDPRVNHAEAEQIVSALKKNGQPVEYLVKMDEGHGFENPKNQLDFYERMEAFLEKYLQPAAK